MNFKSKENTKWESVCDFTPISELNTKLSHEQLLLRERKRESAHGITSYTFHKETNQLLFQYGPHLVACTLPNKIEAPQSVLPRKIGNPALDDSGTRMDAQFTPDGQWIVFARNNELFMTTANPGKNENVKEVQLTFSQNGMLHWSPTVIILAPKNFEIVLLFLFWCFFFCFFCFVCFVNNNSEFCTNSRCK